MRAYEAMILLAPTLDDDAVTAATERVSRLIQDQGGTVDKMDPWGKRRLAYEVDGHRDGTYVVYQFHAGHDLTAEMDRVLRLSDDVLRHIVVRLEEEPAVAPPEEAPAEPVAEAEPAPAEPETAPAEAAQTEA